MFAHSLFNWHPLFEFLFNTNKCFNTIDHLLHQFNFCESNPLLVGNVPLSAWASWGVFT